MKRSISKGIVNSLGWLLLLATGLSYAAVTIASDDTKLKAAFIFNFTKYVTWPPEVEQSNAGLKICFLGADGIDEDLGRLSQRQVRSMNLSLIELKSTHEIDRCQLVYVMSPELAKGVINLAEKKAILTIGDGEEFADRGGVIALVREGDRIRFDINLTRAKQSRLQISSKLLQLGRKVL
ncbi:YfiR family protein [Ketobacter sp. MCCC 1A13808]|uniref:YfiR family protein n=1 Tax=Ketobacter sp. MCCC 1A13808 TaxID=2602738 RepID=UPI000F0D5379|nr:YfiR family protein [Ketobacter sp. MCCC 1A13808]MVF11671.1 YfiR family protein [Ketobacter sp. MCCC 1A13808]RLP55285.1 MAG: YfiR family protein [Ketobacter sp.]